MLRPSKEVDSLFVATALDMRALARYLENFEHFSAIDRRTGPTPAASAGEAFILALSDELAREIVVHQLRGAYLISLCGVFEAALIEIADTVSKRCELPVKSLGEKRGPFLQVAKKYFRTVLDLPLPVSESDDKVLEFLYRLRNTIAHGNGRRGARPADKWAELERDAERYPGLKLDRNFVVLAPSLLHQL